MIPNPKERKTDRILVLAPVEGKKVLSSTGLPDPRLFNGENTLHATMDTTNALWRLRYTIGGVPEPFKQSFTTFLQAYSFAEAYFAKRNVRITEVID